MLRIVHLQKLAGIGGAEKHLLLLLPALRQDNTEIHYLYLEDPKDAHLNAVMIQKLTENGIHCHKISLRYNLDPIALFHLFRCIQKLKPSILHAHLIHGDFYAAICKLLYPKLKYITSKHGYDEAFQAQYNLQKDDLHKMRNRYYYLSRFSIRQADYILCISKGLQQLLEGFSGARGKITTIYYGYKAEVQAPKILSPEYLLYIGRLIPFKHPEMLIQAYIQYRNTGGHLPLRIAGDGVEKTRMQKMLLDAGYLQDVDFMGRIAEPEALLSRAACLCVSSFSEGFGLVILEAMAAGIPVVAFDGPAMNETIVHNHTGILCPIPDATSFAKAMQFYATDTEARMAAGMQGWEKLQSMKIETMAAQTLQLYYKVMNPSLS